MIPYEGLPAGLPASGGFLFSREKEAKRAFIPLYTLAGVKACHTVTQRVQVGPSITMEGPTHFSDILRRGGPLCPPVLRNCHCCLGCIP